MPFSAKQREDFEAAVKALRDTAKGKEATMYTALRDIFVEVLSYPKTSIVIDTAGLRGRPDITIHAPGATTGSRVAWIVGECKDEHGAVKSGTARVALYAEKAKYITADTAYFLMVDPDMLVARPVGSGEGADIEVSWTGITIENFAEKLPPLRAEGAGVPDMLREFRDGNEALIARDKLTPPAGADEATRLAVQINRNVFFDTLGETTKLLQQATLRALEACRRHREEIEKSVAAFGEKYEGFTFSATPSRSKVRSATGGKKTRRTARTLRCSAAT